MKQLWIRGLSGLALAFAAHTALATPVVITSTATSGSKILATSQATVSFATTAIGMLNIYRANGGLPAAITTDGGAIASIGYRYNSITKLTLFNSVAFSTPVTTMTYEPAGQAILGQTLQGSLKIAFANNITNIYSRGGELVLKDLNINHTTKTVYATVSGANGYGTRTNIPLWTYAEITGASTFTGGNVATTLKVLRFTNDGLNAWAQSLALTPDGLRALNIVNNSNNGFGDMTVTVNTTAPSPEVPTCTAP